MSSVREPTTVFKCLCGSYIVTSTGLDDHLTSCLVLLDQVHLAADGGHNDTPVISEPQSLMPDAEVGNVFGVKIIEFRSPKVLLQRLESYNIKPAATLDPCETKADDGFSLSRRRRKRKTPTFLRDEVCVDQQPDSDSDYAGIEEEPNSDDGNIPSGKQKRRRKVAGTAKTKRIASRSLRQAKGSLADDLYKFRCSVCPYTKFEKESRLDWHMRNIHGEASKQWEILTCPLCGRMFNKRIVMQSHLKNHENAEALEDAFNLWESWPQRQKDNAQGKVALKFTCKFCIVPHTNHHSFINHMRTEHPEKDRFQTVRCPYCDTAEFETMKLFLVHMRSSHHSEYYGKTARLAMTTEGKRRVVCPVCEKRYECYYLKEHLEKMHPVRSDQLVPEEDPDEKKFGCPFPECKTRVKSKAQLKTHFVLHLENNPYVCPVPNCGVKCDAQCHLERHLRQHTGEDLLQCPTCKVSYSRKDKLDLHKCTFDPNKLTRDRNGFLRSRYSQLRFSQRVPHDAVLDGPVESTIPNMKRKHRNVDINRIIRTDPVYLKIIKQNPEFEQLIFGNYYGSAPNSSQIVPKLKAYTCDMCATRFYDKKAFTRHDGMCPTKQDGATETNCIEKAGCPICGGSFDDFPTLLRHVEKVHPRQVFKCDLCERMFSDSHVLRKHLQVHEKRFACSSCPRRFQSQTEHMEHKQTCQGTKECPKCGKILVNVHSWRRHCKLIHGETVEHEVKPPKRRPTKKRKKAKPKNKPLVRTVKEPLTFENAHSVSGALKREPSEPVCYTEAGGDFVLGLELPMDTFIKTEDSHQEDVETETEIKQEGEFILS